MVPESRACLTFILSDHPHRPSRHFDGALMAEHSQPIALWGWRATMIAPTIPKGMNASRAKSSWLRSSRAVVSPLRTRAALPSTTRKKPAATGTMLSVRIDQATQLQRLPMGAASPLPGRCNHSTADRRSTPAPSRERYEPHNSPGYHQAANRRRTPCNQTALTDSQRHQRQGQRCDPSIAAGHTTAMLVHTAGVVGSNPTTPTPCRIATRSWFLRVCGGLANQPAGAGQV
jgi:hypothetical protein